MYEVFNCATNRVVKRCRDIKEAHRTAQDYDAAYEWVDGSKFDYRALEEAEKQRLQQYRDNKRKRQGKILRQFA